MLMTKSSSELIKFNCSCFLLPIFFFTACFSTSIPLPSYAKPAENGDPSIHHLNNFPVTSNMKMRSSIEEVPGTDTLLRGRKMKIENAKSTSRHSGNDQQHMNQININPKLGSVQKHYEEKQVESGKRLNHGGISRSDKRTVRTPTSSDMDSFVPCADYNLPHRHPPKNN